MGVLKSDRGIARHERLHAADFDHPLREALEGRTFWRSAILSDPDDGFCIIGPRARFQAVNENAASILLGREPGGFYGLSFFDLFPMELAAERTAYYNHVLRTERTLLVNCVWRGIRCRERWQLLPGDARLAGQVLWQVRRTPFADPRHFDFGQDVLTAMHNDWGPLGALTEEERRVLAHIGAGASTAEIAAGLQLSGREVLRLKKSIRSKLGARSTAALVRHAVLAGLTVDVSRGN